MQERPWAFVLDFTTQTQSLDEMVAELHYRKDYTSLERVTRLTGDEVTFLI